MQLPQTGGCQCRKIRYEITEVPQLFTPATAPTASA